MTTGINADTISAGFSLAALSGDELVAEVFTAIERHDFSPLLDVHTPSLATGILVGLATGAIADLSAGER